MANRVAASICFDLGEVLTLAPVIKRAIAVLGLETVQNLVAEAKSEYGDHFVESGRLRTVGGIFLHKLKQDEHKKFIFKGKKPAAESI